MAKNKFWSRVFFFVQYEDSDEEEDEEELDVIGRPPSVYEAEEFLKDGYLMLRGNVIY